MTVGKKYNKDFFKTWTSDMAYILGFMYADGNIVETKRGNYYIALYTADEKILINIRKKMGSEHKISQRNTTSAGRVYRIQVGSREWFCDLRKVGLFPNKSKRMCLPTVPELFIGDFVRGYFDGDGNVWVGQIHKKRKTTHTAIQVSFTSGSYDFLKSLHKVLSVQGLDGGALYQAKKGNYARLTFSIRDALKLYEIMYNSPCTLFLKRKKNVFEQFMKMRS